LTANFASFEIRIWIVTEMYCVVSNYESKRPSVMLKSSLKFFCSCNWSSPFACFLCSRLDMGPSVFLKNLFLNSKDRTTRESRVLSIEYHEERVCSSRNLNSHNPIKLLIKLFQAFVFTHNKFNINFIGLPLFCNNVTNKIIAPFCGK
jgi:hypothetical protein